LFVGRPAKRVITGLDPVIFRMRLAMAGITHG
jgi:hypothetical protein